MTAAPRNYHQLALAIRSLAGVCDGANAQDGQGFNGGDAGFGRVLADASPERWSPNMANAAYRMAVRYQGQLRKTFRIEVDDIAEPDGSDHRNGGKPRKVATAFDARVDGEEVVLTSAAFPGLSAVAAVKAIPGRRFEKSPRPQWSVPLSRAADVLQVSSAGHVELDKATRTRLELAVSGQDSAALQSREAEADLEVEGLGGDLMPFQRAGVAYASEHLRTFIADEMGLGKTVQALATLWHTQSFPAVIVVPASLKLNWERETRKWLPGVEGVAVLSGRKPLPIDASVKLAIVNYDVLDAWKRTILAWSPVAVVVDESHLVKSPKAKRSKAVKIIALSKTVRTRLFLTGTPVVNSPADLIFQLQALGRLQDLGGWKFFTERYCIPCKWGGFERGGRNLEELNDRMRSGGMFLRRLKKDVLPELPAKRRVKVPIEIRKRATYERALKAAAQKLKAARIERAQADSEGRPAEGWAVAAAMTVLTELRQVVADCKMDACLDWIRGVLETGEKLVIFAHHVAVVERVAEELGCPMIRGGMNDKERQHVVDRFQDDEATRAVVNNIKAGGVGLTLTASSNVVFLEEGWTPADNDQCGDRTHRIGQTKEVTEWYLLADNTIDQWMHDLVAKKRLTVDAATEGAQESVLVELAAMVER